jgi:BirA family transcriptional regulator, biotin operon repressor / biotin---[acetyl-CoA-carboxylase] ligase
LALSGRLGRPFRYFDEIGSTNSEALEWSREGAPHGALVVADHQIQGRGRESRAWFSEPGTALQLSLILRPLLPLDVFGLVSTALSLACADTIEDMTGLTAAIKWPNDVTVERRKVAGILVETRVAGHQVDVAVAGLGINVCRPRARPPELAAASSIEEELAARGRQATIDRSELLAQLLEHIESVYALVESGRGAAQIIERASARSEILGREVVVQRQDGHSLQGTAVRLLPSGALEVLTEGNYVSVQVGEIRHLRARAQPAPRRVGPAGSSTLEGSASSPTG